MKTKLISTVLRGTASVDPRFSAAMLKWIIADIKERDSFTKISIGIDNEVLEGYNIDFELQFKHDVKNIIGMCLITSSCDKNRDFNFMQYTDPNVTDGFLYLFKVPSDPLLHIYLYESDCLLDIIGLLQAIQNYVQISYESIGHIPQNIIPKSADATNETLKGLLSRNGLQTTPASNLKNSGFIKDEKPRGYLPSSKSYTSGLGLTTNTEMTLSNSSTFTNLSLHLSDISPNKSQFFEIMFVQKVSLKHQSIAQIDLDEKIANIQQTHKSSSAFCDSLTVNQSENPVESPMKSSKLDENGIIVLLIGDDLRFISPDRKEILLSKTFHEIQSYECGKMYHDHFMFVFRSLFSSDSYSGYIFKCQTKLIVDDILTITASMMLKHKKQNNQVIACESCPMLWYHNLCVDIEGMGEKKINSYIKNQIDKLTVAEQMNILTKYNGADDISKSGVAKQNQFLMTLLRAHCEYKNERHIHDLEENKIFFTQPLNSKTFFMKAKRSLTNSFDHLLKRKDKRIVSSSSISTGNVVVSGGGDEDKEITEFLRLNKIIKNKSKEILASPTSSLGSSSTASTSTSSSSGAVTVAAIGSGGGGKSWRQEILQRVVTPSKNFNKSIQEQYFSSFMSPAQMKLSPGSTKQLLLSNTEILNKKRTKEELRELWRNGIKQVILLLRMEKENAELQAKQNENEMKRVKLEYEDICPSGKGVYDTWDALIATNETDKEVLLNTIRNGVPRQRRGEIWMYLTENLQSPCFKLDDVEAKFSNFHTPYKDLLKSFTEHQHAIFIDLGRTFPNHKYFKQSLGVGQLSLFNLLKAYSILDPEVGYCQGLGFICGILLLHLDEEKSFEILKYLMFNQQLRLKYLPEMEHFQLQLYQLSRLIKDHLPDLYDYLEKRDISTTLYAAPWILTVFSSQFELGFVTRIFDFLFFEPVEIVFKGALALLILNKNNLLKMENFEDILDYIKNNVPKISSTLMEKILKMIYSMDITALLNEYQIEYNVLQEEIHLQNHQNDILEKTKTENTKLTLKLEKTHLYIKNLEEINFFQKTELDKLKFQLSECQLNEQNKKNLQLKLFINFLIESNGQNTSTTTTNSSINSDENDDVNDVDNLIKIQYLNNLTADKYKNIINLIESLLSTTNNENLSTQTITFLNKLYDYLKNNQNSN